MQTSFKEHPGTTHDSQIIFMLYDPAKPMDNHQTGCIVSMWQTGERAAFITGQGEECYLRGVGIRWVGTNGEMSFMNLYVRAQADELEDTLSGLHKLPDEGYDLSMVQPMFDCTIDSRPGRRGAGLAKLKLARLMLGEV